jgi:stage II sporulation protein P
MKKRYEEIVLNVIYIFVLIWILLSIVSPIIVAKNLYSSSFYISTISKSNGIMDFVYRNIEDEDKVSILPLILKHLVGVDIEDPTSYFETQVPLIGYIDISNLITNNDNPINIVADNDIKNEDENDVEIDEPKEPTKKDDDSIPVVKPNDKNDVEKKKIDREKPLVLIFHTHTTESFNPNNLKDRNFTTDYNLNIVKVGEELKRELEEKYGIAVVHDITIHDLPTREKGYEKSRPTVSSYLKKYPSLKIIIDLHRDATTSSSKTTVIINDERHARLMFVVGAKNKNYKANYEKAEKLNTIINNMYPNLSRGIVKQNAKYNQDLSDKMILLEVGSNLNSLDEAIRTSKIIAKSIAIYLK